MALIELRGIAWQHTRAVAPLSVTAGIQAEFRPVRISWDTRSLWEFGEAPLEALARDYDLLVIDHPLVGDAVSAGLLVPLESFAPGEWLDDQERLSVGGSHRSYAYDGSHWAAAIDAACQVSVARADLLERAGRAHPQTWQDVVDMAETTGAVAIPLKPIDAFSSFLTLCANQGYETLRSRHAGERVVERDAGLRVLRQLHELAALVDPACFDMNPVDVLGRMSATDDIAYVPFTYGYTNFSREGYAPHRLAFGDIPATGGNGCAGATLGGAGLAISSSCAHVAEAAAYVMRVAGAECQRTTYVLAGGQPGHSAAWEDDTANAVTGDFFRRTRATIDTAAVRPNLPGMHAFQTPASVTLRGFLQGESDADSTLAVMEELFEASVASYT